jgi:hypothetical protein
LFRNPEALRERVVIFVVKHSDSFGHGNASGRCSAMPKVPSLKLRDLDRDFGEASEIIKRLAYKLLIFARSLYGLYHLAVKVFG